MTCKPAAVEPRSWLSRLGRTLVAVLAVFLGAAWALVGPLLALATDEVPASDYEGFNTMVHGLFIVMLLPVLPIASFLIYGFTVDREKPVWRPLLLSQLPSAAIAGLVYAVLRT
jgi:uncharacterized BrkB/YihY/UPF0761 family membrane protein